jgi:hypothetical protein
MFSSNILSSIPYCRIKKNKNNDCQSQKSLISIKKKSKNKKNFKNKELGKVLKTRSRDNINEIT